MQSISIFKLHIAWKPHFFSKKCVFLSNFFPKEITDTSYLFSNKWVKHKNNLRQTCCTPPWMVGITCRCLALLPTSVRFSGTVYQKFFLSIQMTVMDARLESEMHFFRDGWNESSCPWNAASGRAEAGKWTVHQISCQEPKVRIGAWTRSRTKASYPCSIKNG